MTMLEHQKKVIENLLDNEILIQKELSKSRAWLTSAEYKELTQWLLSKYNYQLDYPVLYPIAMYHH